MRGRGRKAGTASPHGHQVTKSWDRISKCRQESVMNDARRPCGEVPQAAICSQSPPRGPHCLFGEDM